MRKPDFMIIGAQKAGTTWLWDKLKRHPGTSLPQEKEIHYFGGVENYRNGEQWYLEQFSEVDPTRIVGEASTTYFYDYMPFWHNPSDELLIDNALPPIAQLITERFPDIKVVVSLRDPVNRAISAYRHWMKQGHFNPLAGLKATATRYPKLRIVEYGYYARYLDIWRQYLPDDRLFVVLFEADIVGRPQKTLKDLFGFLGLVTNMELKSVDEVVHKSWSWNRIVLEYYAASLTRVLGGRISALLSRLLNVANLSPYNREDIDFLRSVYLPEKTRVEELINRNLDCWTYGQDKKC